MPTLKEAAYYKDKFTRDPLWSSREPNVDETARWAAIESMLRALPTTNRERRLLDVGCGRGWLTHLCSAFGETHGLEPVAEVAEFAQCAFPGIRFHSKSLPEFLSTPDCVLFGVAVCSEVIEHVPRNGQSQFVASLRSALEPDGWLILTTPRREMLERWRWLRGVLPKRWRAEPDQPVEEPLTEAELRHLLEQTGFRIFRHNRAYVKFRSLSPANAILGIAWVDSFMRLPWMEPLRRFCHHRWAIYQVWCAQRSS